MICASEREAVLDLYDDMIPEQFGDDVVYDELTEEQLSAYTSSVIFHPLCTKGLPGGWVAVAPAKTKAKVGRRIPMSTVAEDKAHEVRVKRAAKQALGRVFVDAVAAAVAEIVDTEEGDGGYTDILAGMSRDEVAKVASHWMHHVNAGTDGDRRYWPESLPRPDRSDWR
jgi:hypothetical protein